MPWTGRAGQDRYLDLEDPARLGEHDVAHAVGDRLADLGPEGGAGGGLLLGCGTPEDLARLSYAADGSVLSYTGVHLARTLLRASAAPD
jgi:excinuclease ABC subunit A